MPKIEGGNIIQSKGNSQQKTTVVSEGIQGVQSNSQSTTSKCIAYRLKTESKNINTPIEINKNTNSKIKHWSYSELNGVTDPSKTQ